MECILHIYFQKEKYTWVPKYEYARINLSTLSPTNRQTNKQTQTYRFASSAATPARRAADDAYRGVCEPGTTPHQTMTKWTCLFFGRRKITVPLPFARGLRRPEASHTTPPRDIAPLTSFRSWRFGVVVFATLMRLRDFLNNSQRNLDTDSLGFVRG